MTDLNELLYFVQVCDAKSFTVAAKLLKVPKSKVSRAIARLEDRLDVRLLERATRRVVLTEEGRTFLEDCRRAMEEAERAELALRTLGADPRGRLRIAAPVMFVHSFLGGLLGEFLRRYPELRLHLSVHAETVNLNPLHANLAGVIQTGPMADSGLVVKPFGLGRRGIYASPAYLKKHGSPDSPSSLRNHSWLTGGESAAGAPWRLGGKAGMVEEVHLEPHVSVADPIVRQQFALAGLGI